MTADHKPEFVDTNILVYAHDLSAGEKQTIASNLLRHLWESGDGCISIQILQEFYVTVTRKVACPLKPEAAETILRDLCYWQIHSPIAGDVIAAIQIQQLNKIGFWDAMVIQSAVRMGCNVIWSEDLNAGQIYQGVTVKNPFLPSP